MPEPTARRGAVLLAATTWRKSSYTANTGNCVEVTDDFPGVVPVRDSKNPGPALVIGVRTWQHFVDNLKD